MTRRTRTPRDGDLVLVTGASRSGKSRYVYTVAKDSPCLIIWDPKDEYGNLAKRRVTTPIELAHVPRAAKDLRLRYVFEDDAHDEFDKVCLCVLAWASYGIPVTFIAEEIADVTTPQKATKGWGMLVRQGRGRGITTYAVTQAPSESDKTTIRNANIKHVCTLPFPDDRRRMEKAIHVDRGALDALSFNDKRGDFVHYVEGQPLQWGVLDFTSGRVTARK